MPNYVSLTESQRRKIAVFITESQQQAQLQQQQQQQQQQANNNGDSVVANAGSPGGSSVTPITGANSISCKEIVQFCKTRFGLTISLSTASRLRSTATERLATELLNPSAKRHRSVKFPEFEKALVQELKALEQEQLQIQQEQNPESSTYVDPSQLPPVMTLTSEAAITQVAKGIAERMGIAPVELGLTSGWYHGFKRRHGIKHRQFKSRSGQNAAGDSGSGQTPASISMETGDGSDAGDGTDVVDGDEEMEDVQDSGDTIETKLPGEEFSNDTGATSSPPPYLKEQLNIPNIATTPKESSTSSLSRRPEVKKVTAATANDALDVISEYLLQNGQIGATKLPLVKELRKFLLSQTELENGASNDSNILTSVGASSLGSGLGTSDNSPQTVNNSSTISTHPNPVLPGVDSFSISTPVSIGGQGMVPLIESSNSSLNLPSNGLITMREVMNNHQQTQEQAQSLTEPRLYQQSDRIEPQGHESNHGRLQ